MKELGTYQNGNYTVTIYDDGTRVRESEDDTFLPSFPECMDVQISSLCYNGCSWCYAGCSPEGKTAVLKNYEPLFSSLHPYTEFAINLNFPLPDDFNWFLEYMKKKNVIVNVTVNQNDFVKHNNLIRTLVDKTLIYGVGVSLIKPTHEFIMKTAGFNNLVLHVINGIVMPYDLILTSGLGYKLLILGYKDIGRGVEYHNEEQNIISESQKWLYDNLLKVLGGFTAVGFDNLAVEQLELKRFMSDEDWNGFYSGDEGEFTFYMDLVNGTFAVNSLSEPFGMIGDKSAAEMLEIVRANRPNSPTHGASPGGW